MTKFFFDAYNGETLIRDPQGTELPDQNAARREAHITIGYMVEAALPDGDIRNFRVDVCTEARVPIYTVSMTMTWSWLDPAQRLHDVHPDRAR